MDQLDDEDVFISAPGTSKAVKKRRMEGKENGEDSIEELKAKIRRIEAENDKVKSERDFYQSRSLALLPPSSVSCSSRIQTHCIQLGIPLFDENYTVIKPWQVEGLEVFFKIRHERKYLYADSEKIGLEITPCIKMTDSSSSYLVSMTAHVDRMPKWQSQNCCKKTVSEMTTMVFASREMDYEGQEVLLVPTDETIANFDRTPLELPDSPDQWRDPPQRKNKGEIFEVTLRLTAVVERLETPWDVGNEATKVVKVRNEEFHVNAAYLSRWSLYFRKIFAAENKDQKAGIFPVDASITAESFVEMLLVIYPTQTPVTVANYKSLLRIAEKLEMPALTRLVERFLCDFSTHSIDKGKLFRIAADQFDLPFVQAMLFDRWRDRALMEEEIIHSNTYEELKPATKIEINHKFVCLSSRARKDWSLQQR